MFDLDAYLAVKIPVTQAMGIRFGGRDRSGFALVAPLRLNLNDKGSAFAGSLATLATLCGWAYTQTLINDAGVDAEVVVARSTLHYLRPGRGDLRAHCAAPESVAVESFLSSLRARGRARWSLQVELRSGAELVLQFQGYYRATLRR